MNNVQNLDIAGIQCDQTLPTESDNSVNQFPEGTINEVDQNCLLAGKYRIGRTLGEGGHGKVKLATDTKSGAQ
ncbi:hypothetical protein HK096_009194, partial [Nowakowskiella sp. JEL0078]